MYNFCLVYWGWGECSVHQGDTMSTSGDVQCIRGYHDARDIMIHVGG